MHDTLVIMQAHAILSKASNELSLLLGTPVKLSLDKPALPEVEPPSEVMRLKKLQLVISAVCFQLSVSRVEVLGESRKTPLPDARKLICVIAHKFIGGMIDGELADYMNRDRTTIINTRQVGFALLDVDKTFKMHYEAVKTALKMSFHDQA